MKSAFHSASIALLAAAVAFTSPHAQRALAADTTTCPGDCNSDGAVTINELIVAVNIALETEPVTTCPVFDASGDGTVTVNEIILGVNASLNDCPLPAATETPTPQATSPTAVPSATPSPMPTATGTPDPDQVPVGDVVARDAAGVAVHLGETVTTEGVLTVSAGIFANNKLKVFAQEGLAGVMVYHETSSKVPAFQAGDRLWVRGLVRQQDPSADSGRAIGTVMVDVTQGSWQVLSSANPQPSPRPVTLQTLKTDGTRYTGSVVRVARVRKVAGNWPQIGDRSTQVSISDDAGVTQLVLRFQRNTITEPLVERLAAVGAGSFDLIGIAIQDDIDDNGTLLDGFEIWVRGPDDIQPAS